MSTGTSMSPTSTSPGTFFYLCSLLDGCSRAIVHWELREAMTEADVEIILQRGLEKYPGAKPRIISDNGPQFIARDFKEFIRIAGLTHVRTSPYYPQSNGKIERWHKSLKTDCIRPGVPLNLQDARRLITPCSQVSSSGRSKNAFGSLRSADVFASRRFLQCDGWARPSRSCWAAKVDPPLGRRNSTG